MIQTSMKKSSNANGKVGITFVLPLFHVLEIGIDQIWTVTMITEDETMTNTINKHFMMVDNANDHQCHYSRYLFETNIVMLIKIILFIRTEADRFDVGNESMLQWLLQNWTSAAYVCLNDQLPDCRGANLVRQHSSGK
uniref:Uncharacterized protein n=1 Tax=Romanomermis culicivorax TaxID=13658 RepID=A0A915K583_ROMCU